MTFNALKHRDIAKIHRVFERLVRFVAGFAFAVGKAAQIDRVLNGQSLENGRWTGGVRQNRVTDVAVVGNDFPGATDMLAIVTAEAA